jgi:hypothetical protein
MPPIITWWRVVRGVICVWLTLVDHVNFPILCGRHCVVGMVVQEKLADDKSLDELRADGSAAGAGKGSGQGVRVLGSSVLPMDRLVDVVKNMVLYLFGRARASLSVSS